MKIIDVHATPLSIPLSDPKIPWFWGSFSQVIVEVKTDDGLTGYGEAFGYGVPQAVAAAVNYTLRPLLIGRDAADISGIADSLFRQTHLFGRYGVTTFAISGVDIALWDLAGKRAGLPLCALLGGAASRDVKAYASLVRYSATQTRWPLMPRRQRAKAMKWSSCTRPMWRVFARAGKPSAASCR